MDLQSQLSRRERQIMDIVYAHGEAPISVVLAELPDPPARGAMGRMIRILEDKGHLRHYKKGREFIFQPTVSGKQAGPSALRRVVPLIRVLAISWVMPLLAAVSERTPPWKAARNSTNGSR